MNTRMRRGEPAMRGVRDTVVDQFDYAIRLLRHPLTDKPAHEIRKTLKRIRAGLRLLREPLGDPAYRQLNRAVRDTGRLLTPIRDAKVLLETLDGLSRRLHEGNAAPLRRTLQQARRDIKARLTAADILRIRHRLRQVEHRLQTLPESSLDRADIDGALKKAYKKAHDAFKVAVQKPDDEHLHEWRKKVKYHFTELEFVESLRPTLLKATIKRAHKLSDCLGSDHDLAVLREKIDAYIEAVKHGSRRKDAEPLLVELQRHRVKLQHKSRKLGKAIYSKKPRRGAEQLGQRANARRSVAGR